MGRSLDVICGEALGETLQHKFRGNKGNIKPEIAWRRLRTSWSEGFEELIQIGIDNDWYDPDDPLERYVSLLKPVNNRMCS